LKISLNLEQLYQYLLLVLAFLMPITVSGANTIVVIICCLWLFSGNYKSKLTNIFSSKLIVASIVFYLIHVIGMLWTQDIKWGFHILHKMWYFLLFYPILFNIVRKKNINKYIISFLCAIALTQILSYSVWFELLESPFLHATDANPTPFMGHIQYNPILAFAIYLVLHEILFNYKLNKVFIFFYSCFAFVMTFNMFITAGRAGQIMFFAMLAILIYQYFINQKIKALIISSLLIFLIFFTAYHNSSIFHKRVDIAIKNFKNYDSDKFTSVGLRLAMFKNSWEIIKKNPLIGVGTGDFKDEYTKINQINTPELPGTHNPHNMYILVLVQTGLIGLISFLSIIYLQIKFALSQKILFVRNLGIALPLLFSLIMLSDTYLLGHYTSLLYVFFSSFLYKDFENL
jgi:O-antigen ligase